MKPFNTELVDITRGKPQPPRRELAPSPSDDDKDNPAWAAMPLDQTHHYIALEAVLWNDRDI